jgi:nitrate/nitrite transport system substrate-binding protein
VAERVYLASDAKKVMEDLGYTAPDVTYKSHMIMGKTFDPATPEDYVKSFAIGKG